MGLLTKITAKYQVQATYVVHDQLELESEVVDEDKPFVKIMVTQAIFLKVSRLLADRNDGDKETYDMLKSLKVGDRLKLEDAWGTAWFGGKENDDNQISFRLESLTVKGLKWDKNDDKLIITCDETVTKKY